MIVTCTIEEADRCGICDDAGLGEHAVFRGDGRIVFTLCMECLGSAIVAAARLRWPAHARELRKAARKRAKELKPITAKEVMVILGNHWTTGKGLRLDTFTRALVRYVARRWEAAVANGTHLALVSSMTREVKCHGALAALQKREAARTSAIETLAAVIEDRKEAMVDGVKPCDREFGEDCRCTFCELDRAIAAARNA